MGRHFGNHSVLSDKDCFFICKINKMLDFILYVAIFWHKSVVERIRLLSIAIAAPHIKIVPILL